MRSTLREGDCVRLADGRIGRLRGRKGALFKVRVRRRTGKTQQFLMVEGGKLRRIACPTRTSLPTSAIVREVPTCRAFP